MGIKIRVYFITFILLSSCSATNGSGCDEYVAFEKGKQLIQDKYPRSYSDTQPIVISKDSGFWRITGTLPPGVAGGVPKVKLDIHSCQLLDFYHTQ